MSQNPYRELPSVAKLLEHPPLAEAGARHSHPAVADAAR
jgi:hypothetical protein